MERREDFRQLREETLRGVMTCERYFEDPNACEIDRKLMTDKYADFFDLQLGTDWRRHADNLRLSCAFSGLFEPHVNDTTQADFVYSIVAIGYEERALDAEDLCETALDMASYLQKNRIFRKGNNTVVSGQAQGEVENILLLGAAMHDVIKNTKPISSN